MSRTGGGPLPSVFGAPAAVIGLLFAFQISSTRNSAPTCTGAASKTHTGVVAFMSMCINVGNELHKALGALPVVVCEVHQKVRPGTSREASAALTCEEQL
eukprot:6368366-Amphidinium_carterae.1